MKSNKKIIGLSLLVMLVFVGFLFVGVMSAKTRTIGITLLTREHVYYNFLEASARDQAKKLGYDLIVYDASFDNAKQMSQVQDFIVQGVDAIIMSPVSEAGGKASVDLAKKANIPVFTMDSTTTGDIIAHVATDNYKGGQLAGEYMAEKVLKGKGKVAIVTYSEIEACVKREEGFKEVIAKYPDIELLDVQNCSGSAEIAANVTQDMLLKHENLDAIFAVGDPFGMGALSAIKATGRDVKIVGFDGNPSGIAQIKRGGLWIADVAQDPIKTARVTLNLVKDYLDGKDVPRVTLNSPFIIDSSNVHKF